MWRNLAKKVASRKANPSSQFRLGSATCFSSVKFSQESSFIKKTRHFEARNCVNNRLLVIGFRQIGDTASHKDELGRCSLLNPSYFHGVSGFCSYARGYASAVEAIASTDEDEESSGSEEIQELLEDWETMLSETAASPAHDQSLLRWVAGDVDDMSCGLKQLLQSGKGNHRNSPIDFDSNAGLGIVDQSPNFDLIGSSGI